MILTLSKKAREGSKGSVTRALFVFCRVFAAAKKQGDVLIKQTAGYGLLRAFAGLCCYRLGKGSS